MYSKGKIHRFKMGLIIVKCMCGLALLLTGAVVNGQERALFPQGLMRSEVFDVYYPLIMAEVEKEFLLQYDEETCRNTREYGYSFFKMEAGDFSYSSPPQFLQDLGNEICTILGLEQQYFTNIILSVYEQGYHLQPHIDINVQDHPRKPYYFDENVIGIIIEADMTGRLYFVRNDEINAPLDLNPIYILDEQPGTVFCLQGIYRKHPFFHAVSAVSKRRISITFRVVVFAPNDMEYLSCRDNPKKQTKEIDMSHVIKHQNEKFFIGLELRTNNEECSWAMQAHKEKFFKQNIISKIPNKINGEILALYTDYEGDYTKPYSWILGCVVSSLDEVPEGLVGKMIPESKYAVFTTRGEFPQGLIAVWQEIWQSGLPRLYTSDFEVYPPDFDPQRNPQVNVYIAIE